MIVTFGFVLMSKTDTNVANVRIVIVNARIVRAYIAIVEDCTIMWHLCEEIFFVLFKPKNFKNNLYFKTSNQVIQVIEESLYFGNYAMSTED